MKAFSCRTWDVTLLSLKHYGSQRKLKPKDWFPKDQTLRRWGLHAGHLLGIALANNYGRWLKQYWVREEGELCCSWNGGLEQSYRKLSVWGGPQSFCMLRQGTRLLSSCISSHWIQVTLGEELNLGSDCWRETNQRAIWPSTFTAMGRQECFGTKEEFWAAHHSIHYNEMPNS